MATWAASTAVALGAATTFVLLLLAGLPALAQQNATSDAAAAAVTSDVEGSGHRNADGDGVGGANDTVGNESSDAILDRILNDVFKDVPEPRAGISRTTWVVTGRVTASWTSYTSFTDSSFGGGVSEFFGASGSITMQGTSAGESLNRYNALYPGFGSSGNWLMQPHQRKKYSSPNGRKVDNEKLMTQLWASVSLRDNIVTVFGYILNVPENPLSTELYTSLYHIYDAVRLRRIPTFDLIRAVNEMAGGSPNDQFLTLFRAMRQVVPRYLQSAISVWIDACRKESKFLDDILRPGGGPLVVDFLAGIEASVIELLSEELEWNHNLDKTMPIVRNVFGATVFEDIFIALEEGYLELTQSLFAILLVNRPTNDVAAEKDETERYLVDVLRLGNVESWTDVTQNVTNAAKGDPDKLIDKVLKLMSESKAIDPLIREDARYLKPYMKRPSVTYSNKYYEIISGVISKPSIDILALLNTITRKEYPHSIVKQRRCLVKYILDGQLNIEFITKGFNRFDHVTPINILIALLTRINRRLPQLPKHISQSVKTLQLFLLYKKYLCEMSSKLPMSLVDVSVILSAYDDPSVPSNVTELVNELATTLPEENIAWENVAQKLTPKRCVRPRQCIFNFLCLLGHKNYLPKGRSTVVIKKLLKLLDRDGNPKVRLPLLEHEHLVGTNATDSVTPEPILAKPFDYETSIVPTFPEYNMPSTLSPSRRTSGFSDERYLLEVERIAKLCRTVPFPPLSAIQQEEPALWKYPATCLPPTVNGTSEHLKMLPAHMLLSWDRLPQLLGNNTAMESNMKKGELLHKLMEKISTLEIIEKFEEVNLYVHSFLQFINSFKKTFRAASVVYFPSLLNALPVTKSDIERQYVAKLKNYFSRAEFYKMLGTHFNPQIHRTRGEMLKYVLTIMSSSQMIKWDPILKKSIDYYIDKVYMNGYGAQEVEWALLSEASEPTYVDLTVFRALDHSKMPQDALLAEYEVIRFIFTEFIPNVHLRDLNVKKLKTKGQFLKGTFEYLISQDSVNPRIKNDIRLLMKYIRMSGRGAEPLDYNADSM